MGAEETRPSATRTWLRALALTADLDSAGGTLFTHVAAHAATDAPAPALVDADTTLSYGALVARARDVAAWAGANGLVRGAVVGLSLHNAADYAALWLSLSAAGLTVALLNTNLRGAALAHCVRAAACERVIADAAGADAIREALGDTLPVTAPEAIPAAPDHPLPEGAAPDDIALLVFTSGTTGLPKAARISHRRIVTWSGWFAGLMDVQPADRLYDCLPMYHSVGGVAAVGAMLVAGASVAVGRRFSTRAFWGEVTRHDCTIVQYVGELPRYLLAAPPDPAERGHRVRLACGNGLRADVWRAFEARFAIPQILEFYAATEGNFSLFNVEGRPGALGRIPPFLAGREAVKLVALEPGTEAPRRGSDGLCQPVARGEVGEAVARVGRGSARFEGYTDAAASERKLLRDVQASGDLWLRSGDLMRQDAAGFFHFVDRVAGSFRWKGENVASAEVFGVVAGFPGVRAAAVFGVAVPGAEGRAGMAALMVEDTFDRDAFARHVAAALPSYARPLVLRLCADIPQTATFRPQAAALAAEGFDPSTVTDPLFLLRAGRYEPLDAATYASLVTGEIRV